MGRSVGRAVGVLVVLLTGVGVASPPGDEPVLEQARSLVNRLLELGPSDLQYENLERDGSPTRLVNKALSFAEEPERASALRRVLVEAVGNDRCGDGAAELAEFLLEARVPRRGPRNSAYFREVDGFVMVNPHRADGLSSPEGPPDGEPEPEDERKRAGRLLAGAVPFRKPFREQPAALLDALRGRSRSAFEGLPLWSSNDSVVGVDTCLGPILGEAAESDPVLGRRLIAAIKGEDGHAPAEGTEEYILLLGLGRWGSSDALGLLSEQVARILGAQASSGDLDRERLRVLGAAFHLAGKDKEVLQLRSRLAQTLGPEPMRAFDVYIGRDLSLRNRLAEARANPEPARLRGLVELIGGDYPWYGNQFSRTARWEAVDFLLDRLSAASGKEREQLVGLLELACWEWTGRKTEISDAPSFGEDLGRGSWIAEDLGFLPDAATAARAIREAGGPSPEFTSAGCIARQAPLTAVLPDPATSRGGPPGARILVSLEKGLLQVRIENVGKEAFAVDPAAFRIPLASLYTKRSTDGKSHAILGVWFGAQAGIGRPDVPPESLRVLPSGGAADFSVRLPAGLPSDARVYAWYQALRVRRGPMRAPLLQEFMPVLAERR